VLIVAEEIHHGRDEHHAATNPQQSDKHPNHQAQGQDNQYLHDEGFLSLDNHAISGIPYLALLPGAQAKARS
jgi:hypothetical protein